MSAVIAGPMRVDGAANEFGAGAVEAGNITNDPAAVEQGALGRHGRFFDMENSFVQVVAAQLEMVLVAAH